jgi:aminoglycoside/choline kinase family phosphotransferase
VPVSDHDLRDALGELLGRPVRAVARRPFAYWSSHPIEELEIVAGDGGRLRMLLKDSSPAAAQAVAAKPEFVRSSLREIAAYRLVLGPGGVDAPRCYGTHVDSAGGRAWLFLEPLEGELLWQTAGREPWRAAARWLADLHQRPAPHHAPSLLRYDAAWFARWLQRARANCPPGALDAVASGYARVEARLAEWPASFVHGEFYASNVLVQHERGGPRIRPLDWEMAGIGPGLLDVAALTAGGWTDEERDELALEYFDACGKQLRARGREDFLDALKHCRLHLAIQWLGWSRGWTPPPEHDHDWLGEARRLARELRL